MPDINPNFKVQPGNIFRDKFLENIIPNEYVVTQVDVGNNIYTIRSVQTDKIHHVTIEDLQIFYIKQSNT